mgnify:CR=1 FL=1
MKHSFRSEVVWVIGASSGIGLAVARALQQQGARVAISARREEVLQQLKSDEGFEWSFPLDVTEPASLRAAFQSLQQVAGRVDRILFMSAGYSPMTLDDLELEELKQIVDINLVGAFNLIQVTLADLKRQERAQLAFCASVAGYRGLPNAQPYGSTKAALINLAESLRVENLNTGLDVKVINPGFVKTPLTDKNQFDMPFIIEPEAAAEYILAGLSGRAFEIHFPKRFTLLLKFLRLLPSPVWFFIASRLVKKS